MSKVKAQIDIQKDVKITSKNDVQKWSLTSFVQKGCAKETSNSDIQKWRPKVMSKSDIQKWHPKVTSKMYVQKGRPKVMFKSDEKSDVQMWRSKMMSKKYMVFQIGCSNHQKSPWDIFGAGGNIRTCCNIKRLSKADFFFIFTLSSLYST